MKTKGIQEPPTETSVEKVAHLSSQPSSPPHDGIPPPRHCTFVGITGRAGCGATSSAALQPKRVGSKRAPRQLSCGSPHRGGTEAAARRLQLGILSGLML